MASSSTMMVMMMMARSPKLTRCLLNNYKICPISTRTNSQQSQANTNLVFNQKIRRKHLDISSLNSDAHVYDYIKDHVTKDVCDRVDDLVFQGKRTVLNLGSCSGLVARHLNQDKIDTFIQADVSLRSLERSKRLNSMLPKSFILDHVQCDEESLAIKSQSVDLVTSCLNLHWVNDLLASFKQVYDTLKPNSVFVGALFGGETLYELRSSLQLAELERLSGFSSHIAPKTTGQDIARLLQSSGFQLITVDLAEIKIRYPSIFELMFDLQGMGENNASLIGSQHMHRDVLLASAAICQSLYGDDKNFDEGIPATFQIIHFIGWKEPHKSSPINR